ncbi:palmitoyl-acyl carrier protein thioesterase [Hibiscus syriacus]|uniref:Palmitoyl-acyl carrier protein thioesterase n=1 Tax=Hibiscus syriacus TaxID=106335 RepID=A0A6A3BKC6_HIBSY|nr:heavy metal-associated isoprenylated plant protein 7-like [Hibiscus syriacus]KAE8717446.1 palmitoyl-acyl carrier protein thioesterase [Hibiscus syriacus]
MGEEEKQKPVEEKEMEEKKADEGKKVEEEKKGEESPVVPQEIVLKVYMHCEGCARKVRRCLKGFQGVEDVMTDCKSNKVVVKGDKADPLKVLERLQRKSHRKVELLSPIPKPPASTEESKAEDKEKSQPEEKKEEPPAAVVTVVLKVYMHCEACAQGIKKRIQRMKGVESAEPDLKSSEVTVKGVFEPPKLVEYVYKRTGKKAVLVKQEAETPKTEGEEKDKDDSKDEKKNEESDGDKDRKEAAGGQEEDNSNKDKKQEGGGDSKEAKDNAAVTDAAPAEEGATEETKVALEVKKNEYYHYPPMYATELYAYPPQIFSDENPNACSVM